MPLLFLDCYIPKYLYYCLYALIFITLVLEHIRNQQVTLVFYCCYSHNFGVGICPCIWKIVWRPVAIVWNPAYPTELAATRKTSRTSLLDTQLACCFCCFYFVLFELCLKASQVTWNSKNWFISCNELLIINRNFTQHELVEVMFVLGECQMNLLAPRVCKQKYSDRRPPSTRALKNYKLDLNKRNGYIKNKCSNKNRRVYGNSERCRKSKRRHTPSN